MHYVFGPYSLDLQRYELRHAGARVPLRRKVFEVLAYLVTQHDQVVSRDELLEAVWPEEFVKKDGLNNYIKEIRKALGDRRPPHHQFLATERGLGYRFVAPVAVRDQRSSMGRSSVAPAPITDVLIPASSPPTPPVTLVTGVLPVDPAARRADEEYKSISVLCCALTDTSTLTTALGVEGLYRLMRTVEALAQEVMQHYAGTLTLYSSGEGFTVVFGAPVAQEDHARRAVLAALALRERLRQAEAQHALAGGKELALGMGVHSGLAVVGGLEAAPQRPVTVVGAPTALATRLQQQATPGAILVSAVTAALVQEEMRIEACGSLVLEGHQAPLPIYAVQGLVRRHAGVPRRPLRSSSPFVGRQREMALLHDRLAAVRAGAGQVVSLVGAPGMGKTRLLTEFGRSLASQ